MVVAAALVVAVALVACAVTADPAGKYCASYLMGEVTGSATFLANGKLDLEISAFKSDASCRSIETRLDRASGALTLVGATDPSTCIGHMLAGQKLTLKAVYDRDADKIDLNLGIADLTMSRC
jgi:hypothetical protein